MWISIQFVYRLSFFLKKITIFVLGGYNYYGTERMYSGVDGRELNASIFFGVVHYQRLRHMVSDKWQVGFKISIIFQLSEML